MSLAVRDDVWDNSAPNAPGRSSFNDPIHGGVPLFDYCSHLLQSNSSFAH